MFGYTPLAGRATRWIIFCVPTMLFQSPPSREGRHTKNPENLSLCYFNPRPSREGRRALDNALSVLNKFQSTPLAGGATVAQFPLIA